MSDDLFQENALQDIGLTKNESRVLLALLHRRSGTASEIASESKVHRVNVYDAIEKLKKQGLVSEILLDNKKLFSATNPTNILNIIQEKEVKLRTILPQLQMHYAMNQKNCKVDVFTGPNAHRQQMLRFVSSGKPIYCWGLPKDIIGIIGKDFQEEIHKRRATQKQWMYHIYNSDAKERSIYLNTLPFTKSRHLPDDFDSPVATELCGNELVLFFIEREITLISITNVALAAAYEKYFWVLWERAQE